MGKSSTTAKSSYGEDLKKDLKDPAFAKRYWKEKFRAEKKVAVGKLRKQLTDVSCTCGSKDHHKAANARDRVKYGFTYCDSYAADSALGAIMANALYTYVAYGRLRIVRDDWDLIEKHAKAIKEFSECDSFDALRPKKSSYSLRSYEKQKKEYDDFMADPENKKKPYTPWLSPKYLYGEKAYNERMAEHKAFMKKKKAWQEAMKWLTAEWHGLWW